ncbi:MAG: FG-GAP repeat protein [Planctomycetes bacterium]|nr:FG-GAP repeat protein [Planctomycetota bacterium]
MNDSKPQHTSIRARFQTAVGTALIAALGALAGCNKNMTPRGGGDDGGSSVGGVEVQSVAPASGPFIGGTLLTIRGAEFLTGEVHDVTIGGQPATDVSVIDATTLSCRTPPGTAGASVAVVVTNRLGHGRLNSGFTYLAVQAAQTDVNGDGIADLIVAAPSDSIVGANAGAVYVFFGSDDPTHLQNRTTAQADLRITGQNAGDAFGTDISIGDVTGDGIADLIVGANRVNGVGVSESGAVYVFRGPLAAAASVGALSANVRLAGESVLSGDRFGTKLALGDLDGDGVLDIMVGADGHDAPGKVDAGCVYVFRGGSTLVSKGAALADMSFDGDALNDRAGDAVTCGDLNGDGFVDLVVCTQYADPMAPTLTANGGKVFVVWGGPSLSTRPLTDASAVFYGSNAEDRFGAAAAVADLNNDGIKDLIVGAPLADGTDVDAGKVYVFFGGSGLVGGADVTANAILAGQPTHNSFGSSLSTGDVNGDGIADLVIGAPLADYLNDDNGRAYLFQGGAGFGDAFAYQATATFNGELIQGEHFGAAVALLDFNDDGLADLVSAAPRHAFGAGRAYMWMGRTTGPVGSHLASQSDLRVDGAEQGALFGAQLSK